MRDECVERDKDMDGGGQITLNGVKGSSLFSHPFLLLFFSLSHINMKELNRGRCLVTTDWKRGRKFVPQIFLWTASFLIMTWRLLKYENLVLA